MNRMISTLMGLMLLSVRALYGQQELQTINAIKSNVDFLYATGTSPVSAEEASANAKDLLALEIEQWLKECATDSAAIDGYVAKSREHLLSIQTRRGKLYRVFALVKKKNVLPFYKEETILVADLERKALQMDTVASVPTQAVEVPEPAFRPTSEELPLLEIHRFEQIKEFVLREQERGTVVAAGKYKDMPAEGTLYLFIYNREGAVPACLKVYDGEMINLATGQKETLERYKGCGAIWIRMKE